MRFVHNLQSSEKRNGPLSTDEIEAAEAYWVKRIQHMTFHRELSNINTNVKLPNESPLRDLAPFLDSDGLLRIGGRLHFSDGTYDERHPLILPGSHHYTKLLVMQAHHRLLHAGVRDTLVHICENFWIIRAHQLVKGVIYQCIICKRLQAKAADQTTAPLPAVRITKSQPFEVVGIDFAGPLIVKVDEDVGKCYIVLFVCAVVRALHLELTSDMSTRAFLQALRRFVSRRGL
ncbi:uncharacterized protein LOC135400524 [Ornithodoros turicata]|uniref:uncharacterized protein LOC135400524 n=1 Tax=Ornithodoros turicata TaxID=34597 RepID=UPI003139A9DA